MELRQLSVNERTKLLFDILNFEDNCLTHLEENLTLIKFDKQDIDFWKYFFFDNQILAQNVRQYYLNGILYYNLFEEILNNQIKLWPFEEHRLNTITNFILEAVCENESIYNFLKRCIIFNYIDRCSI